MLARNAAFTAGPKAKLDLGPYGGTLLRFAEAAPPKRLTPEGAAIGAGTGGAVGASAPAPRASTSDDKTAEFS